MSKIDQELSDNVFRHYVLTGCTMADLEEKFKINKNTISALISVRLAAQRSKREAVDERLRAIASMKCLIGIDSTDDERRAARNRERALVDEIKGIDPDFFLIIEPDNE